MPDQPIEALVERLRTRPLSIWEQNETADTIEKLLAENAEMKERISGICGFPLCACEGSECGVLTGPIPKNERAEAAEAALREIRDNCVCDGGKVWLETDEFEVCRVCTPARKHLPEKSDG